MMSVGGRNGAFQEYLVVDAREASKIPDGMSFVTAAPLACAGMTSWRAINQCHLEKGQWIGIVGSGGGLGHLAIQFAKKARGLKVIAVDARDDGIALSKECGADVVVDAREGKEKVVEEVMKATGRGCDATIELSGHPTAAEMGAAITRQHGRLVQVAIVSISPFTSSAVLLTILVDRESLNTYSGVLVQRHSCQRLIHGFAKGDRRNAACCCRA